MSREALSLRPGWPAALLALAVGVGTAVWSAVTADALLWLSYRATIAGLLFFGLGLIVGSERLVGFAAAPILAVAVFGTDGSPEIDLGRSLIIGCGWYIATELAWESIAWRSDAVRSRAIAAQRTREVATVLIVAIVVGLTAIGLTSLAPSRTLLLRAFAVGSVVASLAVAMVQLNRTRSSEPADRDRQLSEASSNRS